MAASLWLCPPEGSPVEAALKKLINTTAPSSFPGDKVPHFRPHMTITSDIPETLNPQEVVDGIVVKDLPEVAFESLSVGETYFTRVTLHLQRHPSIVELAVQCRGKYALGGQTDEEVRKWERVFTPHVSLVYSALDPVPEDTVKTIQHDLREANIGVASDSDSKGELTGWVGGRIAMVSTHKPIEEWEIMAERSL